MAAGRNIKGITVEIGGDTTGLQKALSGVNGQIKDTQAQLKDVNRLLKLDPSNTELLSQKHRLLAENISGTRDKLDTLKEAERQAQEQFKEGKISQEQYDALKREIIATEKELEKLESTVGSGNAKLAEYSAKAGEIGEKLTGAGEKMLPATAAIAGIGAAAVKTAADFDSAMSNVQAISGATADDMEKLRDKAREMGEKTKFSAEESGDAMSYMAMAGWKTEDMLNGIEGIMNLAAASGEDLATTSDIVTDALTGFGLSAKDAEHFADVLAVASSNSNTNVALMGETFKYVAPIAGSLGVSVEDAAESIGLMANAGIKSSQAGTSLRSIMTRISTDAGASSKKLGALGTITEKLGVQVFDSSGNMRDWSDIVDECRGAWSGLSDEEQTNYGKTIAGQNAMSGWLALMNASPNDIDKLKGALEKADGTAENMANTMNDNLSGQLTILKSQLQELAISFGELLMPAIRKIVTIVQNAVDKFNGMSNSQKKIITVIALIVAAIGPLLITIGKMATGVSAILGIASKVQGFGAIISNVAGAIKTAVTGLFSLITAHPVIAVITAIVATVIVLYNKCEWFRDAVNAVWNAIKKAFHAAWDGIVTFFTETLPAAWQSVVAWFQGIPEWWSGIWQKVGNFFSGIWTTILNNPVVRSVVTTITSLWENAKKTLQGIWSGICNIASGAWELIKNVVLGPVLLLIDLVTGNFTQLKEDAQNIWKNIKNAASTIWNGIKQVVLSLVKGMVTHVVTLITGFKETLGKLWEMVKQVTSQAWEKLKSFVVNTANNLKRSAVQAFQNLVSGIRNTLSNLGTVVSNGFQSAINFITSLPSKALEWGADFINGIADGIRNAIGNVTDAVSGVADKIRSFLHFSVPDEGPLTEYESWMPDFMQGLAKGIEKSKAVVTDAIAGVSKDMTINANAMVDQSQAAQHNAIINITSLLAQYLPFLAQGLSLKWETGEVAAHLARDMNIQLGILADEEGHL